MHLTGEQVVVTSATDLGNFLACRRKTALDHAVMRGNLDRHRVNDPVLEILRLRGAEHEQRFIDAERAAGHDIVDLSPRDADRKPRPGLETRELQVAATLDAMRKGAARIAQAALASNDGRWFGYADVLRRVETPSPNLGAWSYEALDTKLAQETKGATVLQLSLYSDLLAEIQGTQPEFFHVVTPIAEEKYRVTDYAAYYRMVKRGLLDSVGTLEERRAVGPADPTGPDRWTIGPLDLRTFPYPEPVAHCSICDWAGECTRQLRADDHLSFVANCSRSQRTELATVEIATLERLGREGLPTGFEPSRGSLATYERLQDQARLQLAARETKKPGFDALPVEAGLGLCLLPEPSPGDVFLDLEGAMWAREGGREYLFGLVTIDEQSAPVYDDYKAFDDGAERTAFETVIDRVIALFDAHPGMHVYHYAPYEPTALKKLMGRYATRGPELDRLLRAERFIDLYSVVRHAVRAGIESYSIKELEQFYGYKREVTLESAGTNRRLVEHALDMGTPDLVKPDEFEVVRLYNRDDCVSTWWLRQWLEKLRKKAVDAGTQIERPPESSGDPSEELDDREKAVEALRARLLSGVPDNRANRSDDRQARYLVAYLLDWHRRENKAGWWEYFRLRKLSEEELLDEPKAVARLRFLADIERIKKSVVQRFEWPEQELEIRKGDTLKTQDGKVFTKDIVAIDRAARTMDLLVGPSKVELKPTALFAHKHVSAGVIEDAIVAFGERAADVGGVEALAPCPERALLLRQGPSLGLSAFAPPHTAGSSITDYAVAIVTQLDQTALAIQGPPGSGKTFTGARMICALVAAGKKVGVTGPSHKVIRNLLDAVTREATETVREVRLGHKPGQDEDPGDEPASDLTLLPDNESALGALAGGTVNVLGGTAWLWARPEFAASVDVLFVDEAGQVSLANVLGIARAASSVVLLGDPKQLEQPSKGTHPDGVGLSALDHMLGDAQTMPADRGLFLPVTWRLAPSICAFTSELFYAGALVSKPGLERQALSASPVGGGLQPAAGLFLVEVPHGGNRNASDEEADEVASIVQRLLAPGSMWIDQKGVEHQMTPSDIRIVAPFNAHVARLREKLSAVRAELSVPPIGTVDKFQGQEAPVVIYSMATSRPEDAPRGMEFLYSLNRLNVATSRAQCAVIVVANPALLEPNCSTPRQMQLANALGRYREMA